MSIATADEVTEGVLREVLQRRREQDKKFGVKDHLPERWYVILGEEKGEVAFAILEGEDEAYRNELLDVAAVAVAAIECLDRLETKLVRIAVPLEEQE